ncbi:hypothetical protein BC827DRAFT_1156474 [Russula dissimulans]|nr:hypothetical protein BC827DRAFT_1156474 [Russula dissimulans]
MNPAPAALTVYVADLPVTASVDELLNLSTLGPSSRSELKIGWGKPSPVLSQVALAISRSNASRNDYLRGLDKVKIVHDKSIGFVRFLSISVATKVVNTLPTDAWAGKRVNYGKDHCAYIPRSQQAATQAVVAQPLVAQSATALLSPIDTSVGGFGPFAPYSAFTLEGFGVPGSANGTVYLGIHPEMTMEDHTASYQGLTLNYPRLKLGWGKNASLLPPALILAVHAGATRDVLKRNFGEYGDIELVNFLKEKNCAFVNLTNINNATKAIEGVKKQARCRAGIEIEHVGEVDSELVEPPTEA